MLFSDRNHLLSLYNAINGSSHTDPDSLEIVTLENAIYMGIKNDLAFIINTDLCLYEHQSTYNLNMPLRDLFYISSEYQKLVDHKSLYSSFLQKIPVPTFIVFYNGNKKTADMWEDSLSDAFEEPTENPKLELKVLNFNINQGHNPTLLTQCKILGDYAQYVSKVRHYSKSYPLDKAVPLAVDNCIQEGILADFLRKNKAEVITVSIFEYNKEEEERKLRKAEYEAGLSDGMERGRTEGISIGRSEGISIGIIQAKKEAALSLAKHNLSFKQISDFLTVSIESVQEWLNEVQDNDNTTT